MRTDGADSAGSKSAILITKAILIAELARAAEVPRKEAELILGYILGSIVHAIDRGEKVEIRGFGSYRTRQRQRRIGRKPKTGARVEVPAKRIPFFKASQELLKLI